MRVVSIGDLVTDFYYKNSKLVGINGGMSSHNIIANIAKNGIETKVYGVCGNDNAGKIAILSLKSLGTNVDSVKIIEEVKTRCFHVSYQGTDDKLTFTSKKRCPFCNEKRWYDESKINPEEILKEIDINDILVFDNLNTKNQEIIDNCPNKKMLDLGQYFELENYSDIEIIDKLKNKFTIINLNERVEKYLEKRYSLSSLKEIYSLLQPELIIVTRGKNGADFIFKDKQITKILDNPEIETDPTGAGDAFFSMFISEYIKKNYIIDDEFINNTFEKATKLTKKVVKEFGARGHIQKLYKIRKINDNCTCDDFERVLRKQIKRCNININNLETRVINAIKSNAYDKLKEIDFNGLNNCVFVGAGGSYAGAKFAAKVINEVYGINTLSIYPRDLYYRNTHNIDLAFLFTYSGTTNDLIIGTSKIPNKNKYIITKGELQKVVIKTNIPKNNIISYRMGTNKGKERGFLSFEGALAPSSLFLKLYFENNQLNNIEEFIKNCIKYWENYFDKYFKENKKVLKQFLNIGDTFNIFTGDYTESASNDLESKIIESGVFSAIIHEKKNFSHGRFINYEHLSTKKNIYFKQNTTSLYEEKLLNYLENDFSIIVESRYDGILSEYDLLVASQYLMYYIANFLDIDISKPSYSEDAMKIYFYKGEL